MGSYQHVDNVKIYLNNPEVYKTNDELKGAIKDNEKLIELLKQELFGYCCDNIKDLLNTKDLSGEDANPIEVLQCRFNILFDDELCGLRSLIEHNLKLRYVLENYDSSVID